MRLRRGVAVVLSVLVGAVVIGAPAAESSAARADTATPKPAAAPAGGPDARAAQLVSRMTTAEQAASVIMGHIPTTDTTALHGYMSQGFGGFILMGDNIPSTEQELRGVTDALAVDRSLPPLIAIDEEGGIVARLPADTYPSAKALKTQPVEATAAAFTARGALVARSGITVNFGTIADQTSNPSSFIYSRALGIDPAAASDRVAAATTAQEPFVASTLKHFPGHGAAPGDSHHAIPTTAESLDQWRASDALPFVAGIDAGASLLMFGHLAYTAVDSAPASLSPRWHQIARDDLGFQGVIVTDDLGMLLSSGIAAYADPVANAVTAIAAGSDLVLMIAGSTAETAGRMADGIVAAVDAGTLSADRLAEAATRVLTLRLRIAAATAHWTACSTCAPAG